MAFVPEPGILVRGSLAHPTHLAVHTPHMTYHTVPVVFVNQEHLRDRKSLKTYS